VSASAMIPLPAAAAPSRVAASGRTATAASSQTALSQAASSPDLAGRLMELARGYQRLLAANPHNVQALMGMSLVALSSGQHEAAVQMATAATVEAPKSCTAWVTLGQGLKAARRNEEAEQAYQQAIRLDGMNALARAGLGELKMAAGRPELAAREFELALTRQPAMVAAHVGLGHALACMGRNEDALIRYERALLLKPRLPEAEFAAGFVLARLGRTREAEVHYRRALAVRPDFAAAWTNLGNLLREEGRELHAEAALLRSVQLRPDLVPGWLNLALLERERRHPEKAEAYLRQALESDAQNMDTLVAWCQHCATQRDTAGAWMWLGRAIERNPHHAEAVNMKGILLHNEGRFEEAVGEFAQAEELGSVAASSNRGNSLLDLGRDDEALRAHELAVERDRHAAGAQYNLALTRLRLGDWERGWPQYEARWHFREIHRSPRVFRQQRWRGEPLLNREGSPDRDGARRVLLHAEQGLGDTMQFCRYACMVAARGGRVVLEVQKPLRRLLGSLAVASSGLAEIAVLGQERPEFDLECPLMSLPAVFRTTIETVPWAGAYLGADPALVEHKLAQFPRGGRGLRIGIAWAGNPRYKADRQRSTVLNTLLPLLRITDIDWISLQKGNAAHQLDLLPGDVHVRDGSSREDDLADTAALVATLDLVITTDTSIAHLAGAMGKPVWILLPHLGDWRWMQRVETTPWYPSARLFRQPSPGDWAAVVKRVTLELNCLE
jgi:tetratricopeptide (TPR) repeat protein